MFKKRTAMALAATALAAMVPVMSAGSASAGTRVTDPAVTAHSHAAHTAVAPAHSRQRGLSPDATPPAISPGVKTFHVAPGAYYTCPDATLCAGAWDPATNDWEVFELYYCNVYTLYYWNGGGFFNDNQTPGTLSTFYDGNGAPLVYLTAQIQGTVNWDPVYYIRNC